MLSLQGEFREVLRALEEISNVTFSVMKIRRYKQVLSRLQEVFLLQLEGMVTCTFNWWRLPFLGRNSLHGNHFLRCFSHFKDISISRLRVKVITKSSNRNELANTVFWKSLLSLSILCSPHEPTKSNGVVGSLRRGFTLLQHPAEFLSPQIFLSICWMNTFNWRVFCFDKYGHTYFLLRDCLKEISVFRDYGEH